MIRNDTGQPGSSQSYSEMKEDLQKSGEEMSKSMKGTREEISKQAKGKAEGAIDAAADQVEDVSAAAEAAAQALHNEHHEQLSSYVGDIAKHVSQMAESLRHKSADELASDAKHFAHKNPSLFIAGGIAMGFGIARLAKSGQSHHSRLSDSSEHIEEVNPLPAPSSEYVDETVPPSQASQSTHSSSDVSTSGGPKMSGSFSSTGGTATPESDELAKPSEPRSEQSSISTKHENV